MERSSHANTKRRSFPLGCILSNCGLIGGETAEMPSMYTQGDYDLAGFCIGAVRKPDLLPLPLSVDDVLIGQRRLRK